MEWLTINFQELNIITILFRILLAMLIGGIVGFERGINNQAAGIRTYSLVCATSATVMMTNQYVAMFYESIDPTRMGAQVVSGIGFLGAGMILTTRQDKVKGLTTAAGLWSCACIGLAVGIGFYEISVIMAIMLVITLSVFQRIKIRVRQNSSRLAVFIQASSLGNFNKALHFINDQTVHIFHIEPYDIHPDIFEYTVQLEFPPEVDQSQFLREINRFEGVYVFEDIGELLR